MFDVRELLARHPRWAWIAGTAVIIVALIAGLVAWHKLATMRSLAVFELDGIGRTAGDRPQPVALPAHPIEAIANALPTSQGAEQMVQRIAAAARRQGVMLVSGRVNAAGPAGADDLPRGNVSLTLRGAYPAVKSTLGDAVARTRHATLQSLTIRRQASPGDVEAQVVLALWLRPTGTIAPPAY